MYIDTEVHQAVPGIQSKPTLASYPLLHPRSSHTDLEEAEPEKPLSTWTPVPILPTIAEKCFLIIFCESSDMFGACNVSSL